MRTSQPIAYYGQIAFMSSPVIIITGTPGSGKSTLAALLAADTTLQHINIGDWVKQRHLHHGYDPDWQAYTVDEDKVHSPIHCPSISHQSPAPRRTRADRRRRRRHPRLALLRPLPRALARPRRRPPLQPHKTLGPPPNPVSSVPTALTASSLIAPASGYPLIKIQENNEAEIMQVVLDEARASYPHEIVVEMQSDSIDDLHANLQRILDWIAVWRSDHKSI